jgi:hypothetical protein
LHEAGIADLLLEKAKTREQKAARRYQYQAEGADARGSLRLLAIPAIGRESSKAATNFPPTSEWMKSNMSLDYVLVGTEPI